jgi:hypothetical protein
LSFDEQDQVVSGPLAGLRPLARADGLVIQDLGEEVLVFDSERDVAHCLSPDAARVWRACDGEHDVASLTGLSGTRDEVAADALLELEEKGLLAGDQRLPGSARSVSRRGALKRIGAAGLVASGVPLIVSATIATPAAHASGGSGAMCETCTSSGNGTDSCGPGLTCDPMARICVTTGCNVVTCTTGSCGGTGIIAGGTCVTACGVTMCCSVGP